MGIYVFETEFLFRELRRDAADPESKHDFGRDIVPYIVKHGKAVAHRFGSSCVRSSQETTPYWRDAGTVDAYWEANIDLTDFVPGLDIYDRDWPIWTYAEVVPPAKFIHDENDRRGQAVSSLVSGGCIVSGASVKRSLLSTGCHVHSYADIEGAVVLPYVQIGRRARLRNVVVDRGVRIPPGLVVGEDPEHDAARFRRTDRGVCLITQSDARPLAGVRRGAVRELSKVALFTKEYPPNVYGGAGVHVEYLSAALAKLVEVEVRCFGDQRSADGNLAVRGYPQWDETRAEHRPALRRRAWTPSPARWRWPRTGSTPRWSIATPGTPTWPGVLASQLWGVPYVLTIHSLEPLRPWKVEQLGNAYHLSAWMERTAIERADAVIAVSRETREDVLRLFDVRPEKVHVIHNGIDPRGVPPERDGRRARPPRHRPRASPSSLFVGRITRQKGIIHLVNAIPRIDPELQVVLCAGAPDTPEIGKEMAEGVAEVAADRPGVIWIREMLSRPEVIQLYSRAAVFCCPSVYEPFGIINLEAMACETAVVASAVGGIPEVVVPGETGLLVDPGLKPGTFDPADPAAFSAALAEAINTLARDPALRARFGANGRRRVEAHFSWDAIARTTLDLYRSLLAERATPVR